MQKPHINKSQLSVEYSKTIQCELEVMVQGNWKYKQLPTTHQ